MAWWASHVSPARSPTVVSTWLYPWYWNEPIHNTHFCQSCCEYFQILSFRFRISKLLLKVTGRPPLACWMERILEILFCLHTWLKPLFRRQTKISAYYTMWLVVGKMEISWKWESISTSLASCSLLASHLLPKPSAPLVVVDSQLFWCLGSNVKKTISTVDNICTGKQAYKLCILSYLY